jgi:HSP20 family protein
MTTHHPTKGVELYQEDDAYVVLFDLPNHDPEDIEVRWHDSRLHVEAPEREGSERHRVFHRSIGLPKPIRESGISASFDDGVLTVTVPVSDDGSEHHFVDVQY